MSGWTCITIEPKQTTEEELPDLGAVEALRKPIEEVRDELEGDETDPYFIADMLNSLAEDAEELAAESGEVDAEERVIDYIEENKEIRGDSALIPSTTPTYQYHSRNGASYTEDSPAGEHIAESIFEECEYAARVLIVSANDTSDSGAGELYTRTDDGAELVDHWVGYEGAVGSDVTGYFAEEHGISGVSRPY